MSLTGAAATELLAALAASSSGGDHCLRAALSAGIPINVQRARDGATALHLACGRGEETAVHKLLAAGAAPGVACHQGSTPLHWAARGHAGCLRALLAAGADATATCGKESWSAVHLAAGTGCTTCLHALLGAGAPAGAARTDGVTALMLAAGQGHAACCTVLLRAGASHATADGSGDTALHHAARSSGPGARACVAALLAAGATAAARNGRGQTPLALAREAGSSDATLLLWEQEAALRPAAEQAQPVFQQAKLPGPLPVLRRVHSFLEVVPGERGSWRRASGVVGRWRLWV